MLLPSFWTKLKNKEEGERRVSLPLVISVVAFMALLLWGMCCLHAPLRVSYKGFFFLTFFLALPRIPPSLVPFQLSPTSPSLTSGSTANTTSLTETSSWVILPRKDPHIPVTVCLPCIACAASSTVACHPCMPVLGIPDSSLERSRSS